MAVAIVLAAASAAPAAAVERTAAEVRALAARGAGDEAALAALRSTTAVDGRRVDLGAALARVRSEQLEDRLRALATPPAGAAAGVTAADARGDAADVLREARFGSPGDTAKDERPLGTVIGDWLGDRFDDLDALLPGGSAFAGAALGLLVLILGAVLSSRVASRLQLTSETRLTGGRGRAADPAALEREAAAAEAGGDYAAAVRLRFAAGLVRLDAAHAIRLRPSLTTGQVARELGSERFDALAATFEEVAYGDRPAQPADAEVAREEWPRVLEQAGR